MKKIQLLLLALLCYCTTGFAQQWLPFSPGVGNTTGDYTAVYSMLEFNNELYVAGCFTSINGTPASYIARYNGTTWSAVGQGLSHTGNTGIMYSGVRCLAVYNGELYAGGIFNRSGNTTLANVAKWDGSSWVNVGDGFTTSGDGVLSLCVFNNELYAGGRMLGAYNSIAKWTGTAWTAMGAGMHHTDGSTGLVRRMRVFNNKLYVGGQFASANGVNSTNLVAWNGTAFTSIGAGVSGDYGVACMTSFNNELIIGGGITAVNGMPCKNIARFSGSAWSGLGTGLGTAATGSFEVEDVLPFNNKLVAVGFFTTAGSVPVNGVAAWNGSAWEPMAQQGFGGVVITLNTFRDSLFAGGAFTTADGLPAAHLARWSEPAEVLGIGSAAGRQYIKLFPNPSTGQVNIEGAAIKPEGIRMFNALGREIFREMHQTGNNIQLDISDCPPGIYFIHVIINRKLSTYKVIRI